MNKTALNGHIVAFSRNIVAGDPPSTIAISDNWWDLEDLPLPSPHTAASEVTKLIPDKYSTPEAVAIVDQACIPLTCITSHALVHPLMTAPYLSPAAAYTLLSARVTAWIRDAPLAPLMKLIKASQFQTCPAVKSLLPLEMSDHITVVRQNLQQHLVPRTPAGPEKSAPTYIMHQSQQVAPSATTKNKNRQNVGTCKPHHFKGLPTSPDHKTYHISGILMPPSRNKRHDPPSR